MFKFAVNIHNFQIKTEHYSKSDFKKNSKGENNIELPIIRSLIHKKRLKNIKPFLNRKMHPEISLHNLTNKCSRS